MSQRTRSGAIWLYDPINEEWLPARCDTEGRLYVSATIPAGVDVTDRWSRQLGQVDIARVSGAALSPANPLVVGIYDALGNRMPSMDAIARAGYVDLINRWAREVGQIDLARYGGVAVGPANPIDVTPGAGVVFDVSDRWARQLGQIDLARVLGGALSTANPVITGIYDAAGNRMPSMDAAVRPGYVDEIDRWARQLGQIDLARVLGGALSAANPVITGVFDAAGNRMPAMDADARKGYVEIIPAANLYQGTRTTTAGAPIPISAASQAIRQGVLVQADLDNTGRILIGNNAAQPMELEAGDWIVVPCDNVQDVYFDVTVNGERVNWMAA